MKSPWPNEFPFTCPKGKKQHAFLSQLLTCNCKYPTKACRRAKRRHTAFNLFYLTGGFKRVGNSNRNRRRVIVRNVFPVLGGTQEPERG